MAKTAEMRRVGRRHPAYPLACGFHGASSLGPIKVKKNILFPRSRSRKVVVGAEGVGWKDKRCRSDKPRISASAIRSRPPRPRLRSKLPRTFPFFRKHPDEGCQQSCFGMLKTCKILNLPTSSRTAASIDLLGSVAPKDSRRSFAA